MAPSDAGCNTSATRREKAEASLLPGEDLAGGFQLARQCLQVYYD